MHMQSWWSPGSWHHLQMTHRAVVAVGVGAIAVACTSLLGCSDASSAKRCVSSSDASVCAARDGGRLSFSATGLKPGSTVTFATPETESSRVPIGPSGGFDGNVGLLSASGTFVGTIAINATTAGGVSLSGELSFE